MKPGQGFIKHMQHGHIQKRERNTTSDCLLAPAARASATTTKAFTQEPSIPDATALFPVAFAKVA